MLTGVLALTGVGVVMWWLTDEPAALVMVALGIFALVDWKFPIFDRWVDRGRLVVGSTCELSIDEAGVPYRQIFKDGAIETTGRLAWSALSAPREDDRVILLMDGRVTRIGIPKRAFRSAADLGRFRSEFQRYRVAARIA